MITFTARTVAGLATAVALTAAPIALPGSAAAAPTRTASVEADGDVSYNGGAADNTLVVTTSGDTTSTESFYLVFHDSVDIRTGFNCDHPSKTTKKVARCLVSRNGTDPQGLAIDLGAGNDSAKVSDESIPSAIHGGAGNDRIVGSLSGQFLYGDDGNDSISGGSLGEFIYGGKGNDRINGNAGKDTIYGNSGDDVLNGGLNDDTISGGPGHDRIDGGPGKNKITP